MSLEPQLTKRPIPSLAQWLGDGVRAEGFEEWVSNTIELSDAVGTEDEKAALRMIQTLAIAMMEVCRRESDQHGRNPGETVHLLARTCGLAIMSPVLSLCQEQPASSLHSLVRVLADEFKAGAKLMIRTANK